MVQKVLSVFSNDAAEIQQMPQPVVDARDGSQWIYLEHAATRSGVPAAPLRFGACDACTKARA